MTSVCVPVGGGGLISGVAAASRDVVPTRASSESNRGRSQDERLARRRSSGQARTHVQHCRRTAASCSQAISRSRTSRPSSTRWSLWTMRPLRVRCAGSFGKRGSSQNRAAPPRSQRYCKSVLATDGRCGDLRRATFRPRTSRDISGDRASHKSSLRRTLAFCLAARLLRGAAS